MGSLDWAEPWLASEQLAPPQVKPWTSDVRSPGRWGWESVAFLLREQEPWRRTTLWAGGPDVQQVGDTRGGPSLTLKSCSPFGDPHIPGRGEGFAYCQHLCLNST